MQRPRKSEPPTRTQRLLAHDLQRDLESRMLIDALNSADPPSEWELELLHARGFKHRTENAE
jgi:hypothetical protein